MPIATLANAPEFKPGALHIRALAVPSRGTHELACWRVDLSPGAGSGVHSLDREQLIVVQSGAVSATVGTEQLVATAGDTLVLPAHTAVEMRNDGTEPAVALVVSAAGFKASVGSQSFQPPWSL